MFFSIAGPIFIQHFDLWSQKEFQSLIPQFFVDPRRYASDPLPHGGIPDPEAVIPYPTAKQAFYL